MRSLPQVPSIARGAALSLLLTVRAALAEPMEMAHQTITLPANAVDEPLFVDIEGKGRADMFVMDPAERKLLHYRQRSDGFANPPDQEIPVPPQTAWAALCDVDAQPGLELIMSTANGVVYSRQNAGLFEPEFHVLIQAHQDFPEIDFPILTSLSTNQSGTNVLIPIISARQMVLYQRNNAYEWSAQPPQALLVEHATWRVNHRGWTLRANPAQNLGIEQSLRARPDQETDDKPENNGIGKIMEDMKKNATLHSLRIIRKDVDGDGREDLVLWQRDGNFPYFKTDLYLFLRGPDQKLPEQPTQSLHCRGLPIPTTVRDDPAPLMDLRGDGRFELVVLDLETRILSFNGAWDTAVSHGLDWSLTIRSFQNGAFSRNPDAAVPVTVLLSSAVLDDWPISIQGDFNGDGRPDLLVRRSDTHWNIYPSTTDGRWFAPQPMLTFEAPARGYFEINNLVRNGLSDIIWHEPYEGRLSFFMSPPRQAKGTQP